MNRPNPFSSRSRSVSTEILDRKIDATPNTKRRGRRPVLSTSDHNSSFRTVETPPMETKRKTRITIPSSSQKQHTNQKPRRRHRSFSRDRRNNTTTASPSQKKTPQKSIMRESREKPIHRQNPPSPNMQRQPLSNKDITTLGTARTQSMSTASPKVRPAVNTSPNADEVEIFTDLSNLTESPSLRDVAPGQDTDYVTPGNQVLASMARLQQLELKRNTLRHQRFCLEQRLYNFHRVATIPLVAEEQTEPSNTVVDWKYNGKMIETKDCEKHAITYTGGLNASGVPHDDRGIFHFGDGQVYEGTIRNGERHGFGTNHWPDGQFYRGDWSRDSRCGMGTHSWKDGRTVTGTWKDGHLHGKIFFRWPNGAMFDGNANMGRKEGKGVNTRLDGTVYNGNYRNGKEDGFGTLIRPDGVKYRGEFKDGQKEGYGVMLWKTRTYDGEWLRDKPHGRGRVVWSNGAVFTGQFQQGTYSGLGVYIWPSGKKFVGRWENGVKSGHGLHTWPNGKKYDGEYKNGIKEGYGRMTWPDGSVYCGGFKQNQRCGRGVQTDSSGSLVHCGLWKDDKPFYMVDEDPKSFVLRRRTSMKTKSALLLPKIKIEPEHLTPNTVETAAVTVTPTSAYTDTENEDAEGYAVELEENFHTPKPSEDRQDGTRARLSSIDLPLSPH